MLWIWVGLVIKSQWLVLESHCIVPSPQLRRYETLHVFSSLFSHPRPRPGQDQLYTMAFVYAYVTLADTSSKSNILLLRLTTITTYLTTQAA